MTAPSTAATRDLAAKFAHLPTTIIGDSQDRFGIPAGLRPIWNSEPFAGEAYTVLTAPGDNLGIHRALAEILPGQVLVVDGGGYEARALIGDLVAEKALALQVAALVIDGAVRDVADIESLGIPVYARTVIPAGPWKNGPYRLNAPVTVGGVVVSPGDIIVGDRDGIAVVSPRGADAVLATCHERVALEESKRTSYRELKPNA